jgi:hypothetical protein
MDDPRLDALLGEMLAPPSGLPDLAFVARVDRAVTEAERYRRWQAAFRRQLVTEALTLAALAGSLAFLARAPAVAEALAAAPGLFWPALVSLLLLWALIRGRPRLLA